jgi:hypothetical protein
VSGARCKAEAEESQSNAQLRYMDWIRDRLSQMSRLDTMKFEVAKDFPCSYMGRSVLDQKKMEQALKLYDIESHTVKEIEELTGVKRATLYRAIAKRKES